MILSVSETGLEGGKTTVTVRHVTVIGPMNGSDYRVFDPGYNRIDVAGGSIYSLADHLSGYTVQSGAKHIVYTLKTAIVFSPAQPTPSRRGATVAKV